MSAEEGLIAAAQRGDVAAVAAALAAGPNDKAWAKGVNDAVHVACQHGRLDCLHLLLAAGAEPNTVLYRGDYSTWSLRPIHKAVQAGHLACVAALLDAGADPCATCSDDRTPLALSLHQGDGSTKVVRLLLAAAPQAATMADSSGRTPLHLGVGNIHVVRLLLAAAPQAATMRDSRNLTPLDMAIEAVYYGSAQLLLAEADLQPAEEITDRLIQTLVRLDRAGEQDRLRRLAPAVPVFLARLGLPLDTGNSLYTFERYRSHMVSPDLAWWLPGMLRRSDAAAARLVPFLPPPDRQRLRTLALCLVRYQRSLSARLPAPIAGRLLALAAAQHTQHVLYAQANTARARRSQVAKGLALHVFFVLLAVAVTYLMRAVWGPKP